MILELDRIGDFKTLSGLLRNFGIELTRPPALPVTLQELANFLRTDGISTEAVSTLVSHINRNVEMSRPADRDRATAHIWPNRTQTPNRCLSDEMYWAVRAPIVTRHSKIAYLGSSYAVEMAKWAQLNGYNDMAKEPNAAAVHEIHGSAALWGTISNAPAFRQIVNWAFGLDVPPLVVYRANHQILDPFREGIVYAEGDLPHLERLWQESMNSARAALQDADVVVLMLDMNEVYRYLPTGHYLHHPPRINPAVWEPQILGVDDNVAVLKAAIEQLRSFNPNVRFIVGVSPTPLLSTFRRNVHVAAANAYSKAVLRIALEHLCNSVSGVHYLASFETAMYTGRECDPWAADERHSSNEHVAKVMRLFQQQFCAVENALLSTRNLVPPAVSDANPYFEIDHRIVREALERCVARGLVDAAPALDTLIHCTPALYKNKFYGTGYALLRPLSFKSRFNFNLLCRKMYREAFPTSFTKTPQSDEIYHGLSERGCHAIAATPQSRQFAAEMLEAMASMPTTREVDEKVGRFVDLAAEDVPGGFRFFVGEDALPVAPAVRLLEDLGVLRAIGDDLGHPILRNVTAWYSVRPSEFTQRDLIASAHQYHADNDTPTGWIKVFIYLTDVSGENGPHVFVPGSHGELPAELSRDRRFRDEEVEGYFGPGHKFEGPAGTVIVVNTQGLHKALPVHSGVRAIYQLECVNCLFGAATERLSHTDKIRAELAQYDERFLLRYSLKSQRR